MLGPPGCPERSKDAREGQGHLRQETVKVNKTTKYETTQLLITKLAASG